MAEVRSYVLVTGASSGIGRAIAMRLSCREALILNGRDPVRLEQTRRACAQPETHLLWPFDLVNTAVIQDALPAFLASHTAVVGGFVHCAGAVPVLAARAAALGVVTSCLNVNYVAAQQIVTTLLKKRVNAGSLSRLVFISSVYSNAGARGYSLYCAAKAALDGMMRALAIELAPAVRVNSVLPGGVQTPMAEEALGDPTIAANIARDYPLGLGQAGDIAAAVAFLLSDEARWITGQQFVVDGGRSINLSPK